MTVQTGSGGPQQALDVAITSVLPSGGAAVAYRPLGSEAVRIDAGFWAGRQRLNRETSIPAGHDELERAGNFDNLRIVAGSATGSYRGRIFNDSDVYKWLEAVGWELARERSAELEALANDAIDLIEAAQDDDGYLNSYFTIAEPGARFTNPQEGHELYCAGHLFQAAVAHARSTGNGRLLAVARRFADHVDARFGPGREAYVEGHPEVEMALVELFRVTGERRYLDLACHFIDQRGHGWLGAGTFGSSYFQDHEPVRSASTVAGHSVRALYLAAGVTDAYVETGDASLLAAVTRQWDDMVSTKTYLTGGVGSRHKDESFGEPYELPPDRAYCETCAAISSVMWSWRMLLVTGEARYADLIERTLYNGFAASTSLDGKSYFYVNPLQTRSARTTGPDHRGSGQREPWYRCACCPPNIMRLTSSLGHYLASVDADGIQLHQYAAATIRAGVLAGPDASLRISTDYPWDGRIEIVVDNSEDAEWTLSMRIPAWSTTASVSVNGEVAADESATADGYVRLHRRWRAGDAVTLQLDMSPRFVAPHHRVDAVRGCVAIERGPLVYCLEQADLEPGVALADIAADVDAPLTAVSRPDLLGGVTVVELSGVVRSVGTTDSLYDAANAPAGTSAKPVALMAIPYYAWANREAGAMRIWIPEST